MNIFEKQLSDSSKRIESEQMKAVPPVERPKICRNASIAWYTTPVAAFLGLLLGLFLQFDLHFNELNPSIVVVRDTIVNHINDTVFVETELLANNKIPTSCELKDTICNKSESGELSAIVSNAPSDIGKNILEDGIDYSKLISSSY